MKLFGGLILRKYIWKKYLENVFERKYLENARKINKKDRLKPLDLDEIVMCTANSYEDSKEFDVEENEERALDGITLLKINEIKNIRIRGSSLLVDYKHRRVFYTDKRRKKIVVA